MSGEAHAGRSRATRSTASYSTRSSTRSRTREPEVALSLLEGGERLLDLGCWHGAFLARVERAERYRQLVGVEIVAEGVDRAHERGDSMPASST